MNSLDLRTFRDLALRRTGMQLGEDKEYFVATRLEPVAARHDLSCDGLAAAVRGDPDGALAQRVAEALLVAETTFFRDVAAFEALSAQVLPALIAARAEQRELNIWSAACATGQEPYSLVMLLRERFPQLASWRVRIVGSDVSQQALDASAQGLYSHLDVNRGLPARHLVRHFQREGLEWRLSSSIRDAVELRRINLVEPLPALPTFDLVLLRNVLIYLDVAAKAEVLQRVRRVLRPDGVLVLGAAETTIHLDEALEPVPGLGAFYRQKEARAWT